MISRRPTATPSRSPARSSRPTVDLANGDSVDSVSLASDGAAATASVAGGPYAITASAATGTGLANYDITYVDGSLTVDLRPLTVTADDQAKTYGQAFSFDGTEFSTDGPGQLRTASTASPWRATALPRPATVAGSPYAITASAATGTGLGELRHQLRRRLLDRQPAAADDHRGRSGENLR